MTEDKSKAEGVNLKKCHSCLDEIDSRAKRCPHCTAMQLNPKAIAYNSVGLILTLVILFVLFRFMVAPFGDDQPNFGGKNFPAAKFNLDFTKRYDVILASIKVNKEESVLRGVKFLGWVGAEGSTTLSSYEFNRWIVLEQNDGKKVFVPSHTISMIIEAEEAKSPV